MAGAAAGTEKAAMVASVCIVSVASSGQSGDVFGGSAGRRDSFATTLGPGKGFVD